MEISILGYPKMEKWFVENDWVCSSLASKPLITLTKFTPNTFLTQHYGRRNYFENQPLFGQKTAKRTLKIKVSSTTSLTGSHHTTKTTMRNFRCQAGGLTFPALDGPLCTASLN